MPGGHAARFQQGDSFMSTNLFITAMVALVVNAVIFGLGVVPILAIPALVENAKYLIPFWIVVTFALSPFIARAIAPRLRLRTWRERGVSGDMISG